MGIITEIYNRAQEQKAQHNNHIYSIINVVMKKIRELQ